MIDIIFRYCNFIIVVVLAIYVIRRYVIISLISLMRKAREQKAALVKQFKNLQKELVQIEDDASDQEKDFRRMQAKFKTWSESVEVEKQQILALLEKRKEELEYKQMQKVQSLQQRKLVKEQFPELLEDIKQDLQKEFADDTKQAQAYTNKLFRFLEE